MFGPCDSAYAVNLTYDRHTPISRKMVPTRKWFPLKGRAKVKLFDVHALCVVLTYVKRALRVIELANSKQSSRRCTRVHSSASRKIVSTRIVVLTYLRPNIFSIGSNRGCLTRFARSTITGRASS